MRPRAPRPRLGPAHRPMIAAHRGDSLVVAEHTLAAFENAVEAGADALECDVRMTRDGHLICVHDRTVNRTSDGSGIVSELDLPSLEQLDFASWRGDLPESADQLVGDNPYLADVDADGGEHAGTVLTLEMLLALVHDSGRGTRLLIETKHPTRYAGLVEKTLIELLDRFGWAGPLGPPTSLREPADLDHRVMVMSFAPTAVRRIRLLAPKIPTVLLMERLFPLRREGLLPAGVSIAGPGLHLLRNDPAYVERVHSRGHRVFVWTVDEMSDVRFVRDLGVDAIITDCPREVVSLLNDERRVR